MSGFEQEIGSVLAQHGFPGAVRTVSAELEKLSARGEVTLSELAESIHRGLGKPSAVTEQAQPAAPVEQVVAALTKHRRISVNGRAVRFER